MTGEELKAVSTYLSRWDWICLNWGSRQLKQEARNVYLWATFSRYNVSYRKTSFSGVLCRCKSNIIAKIWILWLEANYFFSKLWRVPLPLRRLYRWWLSSWSPPLRSCWYPTSDDPAPAGSICNHDAARWEGPGGNSVRYRVRHHARHANWNSGAEWGSTTKRLRE